MMITQRQLHLLRFIDAYIRRTGGVSPSMVEMADHLGIASKSAISSRLGSREKRGWIRRLHGRWRAIEIIKPVPPETDK